MSDAATSSKSAKKNKKKRSKTKPCGSGGDSEQQADLQDVLLKLKEQLEIAKTTKDHKSASKLRDQIWVLTDVIRGVKTDLPDDELEEIINSLPLPSQPKTAVTEPAQVASAPGGATTTSTDRRLKTLEKKLKQIEEIKKKQTSGEKLEKNQIEKMKAEESIKAEIEEITEAMKSVL